MRQKETNREIETETETEIETETDRGRDSARFGVLQYIDIALGVPRRISIVGYRGELLWWGTTVDSWNLS